MRRRAPQRAGERERERERESELALAPLFIRLFLPGPVLCKLGQPGVLFVLPEVLTPVHGLSFVLFFLLCLLATAIWDSFSLFYLPNRIIQYVVFCGSLHLA